MRSIHPCFQQLTLLSISIYSTMFSYFSDDEGNPSKISGKLGKKKLLKMEEKAEKKKQREAELQEREERKKRLEKEEQERNLQVCKDTENLGLFKKFVEVRNIHREWRWVFGS